VAETIAAVVGCIVLAVPVVLVVLTVYRDWQADKAHTQEIVGLIDRCVDALAKGLDDMSDEEKEEQFLLRLLFLERTIGEEKARAIRYRAQYRGILKPRT
jgi:hypothetical protein